MNFNHDVLTSKDTHQNHSSFQFLSGNDTLLKNDIQRKDSKESVHQLSQWIDDTMAPTSALNASDAGLQPLYHQNDKIGGGGKASSMMAEKVDKIDLLDSYLQRINAALQKRARNDMFDTNTNLNQSFRATTRTQVLDNHYGLTGSQFGHIEHNMDINDTFNLGFKANGIK